MLALSREARQALDQFQGRMSGELVVGGSTIPGEYVLPALIGRFKAKYPEISVSLLIGASRQVTEWAEEGRVEVAIVGAPPGPRSLAARELMADELVVVVPADHPWVGRKTVALADLKTQPLIVRERGSASPAAPPPAPARRPPPPPRPPRRRGRGVGGGGQPARPPAGRGAA